MQQRNTQQRAMHAYEIFLFILKIHSPRILLFPWALQPPKKMHFSNSGLEHSFFEMNGAKYYTDPASPQQFWSSTKYNS